MSDEIIPWEVDIRITGLQAEIDRLRGENAALFQEGVISNNELARLHDHVRDIENELTRQLEFNQRLMKELSRWGWGDFHYSNNSPQDRDIVALLEEGGFQYERVETIDINTEPNVFEAIVVPCQKTDVHEPHGWIAGDPANPTTYEAYWCGGIEDEQSMEARPGSGRDDGIGTTGQETV